MKKDFYDTLQFRITSSLSLGVALIFLGILFLILHRIEKAERAAQYEKARIVSTYLSELASEKIVAEDWGGLEHLLSKYQKLLKDGYIIIEDFSGKVVTHSFAGKNPVLFYPDSLHSVEEKKSAFLEWNVKDKRIAEVFRDYRFPIRDGLLGFIRVGFSEREFQSQINKKKIFIWILFLFGIFLAIILTVFIVTLMVRRPIIRLIAEAYRVSMGQLNQPVTGSESAELKQLSSSMERIRISLKLAMDRLKK
ncbi:MAG: hypothetical protein Kow0037_02680 [Calditrichia bacterium]